MLAAMRSLSALPVEHIDTTTVRRCLENHNTPKQVALEAVRILKKVPISQEAEVSIFFEPDGCMQHFSQCLFEISFPIQNKKTV